MRNNPQRILVPVNGDAVSERTFRWACQTARETKAELHAVYVIEVPLELPLEAEITEEVNRGEEVLNRIEAIAAQAKCKGLQARYMRARDAGPAIVLETRDRNMDAVIVGIPFRRRFGSCDLGTTASFIFNNATCQVVLWRDPASSQLPPRT